uniref:Uncharacterized protein n=1 Tax=Brassica oleracea var. oleracea TaxID=109376 RepID=A0A0D3CYJ8_BRAOL
MNHGKGRSQRSDKAKVWVYEREALRKLLYDRIAVPATAHAQTRRPHTGTKTRSLSLSLKPGCAISSNRRPGVRHSTFESLRLGLSSQSITYGFLRFWDSLNFKKDREFVGIMVLFLDEKIP